MPSLQIKKLPPTERPKVLSSPEAAFSHVGAGPETGFSLLEVLVASTLVGLILVVLLEALGAVWRTEETVRDNTRALFVAEKVLQENCELVALTEGAYQGQYQGFNYRVQVTPQYEVPHTQGGRQAICALIRVTVFWRVRNQNKSLALETVRTGPPKKA